MGRKLNRDEFIESSNALREYFIAKDRNHGPYSVRVEVLNKRNDSVILRVEPTIVIYYDNMCMRINIMWEDAGYSVDEFRNMGLYGYYDCTWVPMEYSDETLIIRPMDSDKIIKVYA